MSYKIFTYADPYRIKDTDFWKDIKGYPQLCASRTLVNGLMSVMGDEIESLLCPLDDIVNKRVFPDWSENIGRRIQQYSNLGQIFSDRRKKKLWLDCYYESLSQNKDAMLDAIRLFIELDIHADELDVAEAGFEHRVFAYLLGLAEKDRLFSLPKLPSVGELITHFKEQAKYEKEIASMAELDRENVKTHAASGSRIRKQGWAIDKDGGISKWSVGTRNTSSKRYSLLDVMSGNNSSRKKSTQNSIFSAMTSSTGRRTSTAAKKFALKYGLSGTSSSDISDKLAEIRKSLNLKI